MPSSVGWVFHPPAATYWASVVACISSAGVVPRSDPPHLAPPHRHGQPRGPGFVAGKCSDGPDGELARAPERRVHASVGFGGDALGQAREGRRPAGQHHGLQQSLLRPGLPSHQGATPTRRKRDGTTYRTGR